MFASFKKFLCLSSLIVLCCGSMAFANSAMTESSGFTNIGLSSGLSQMSVMNIFQDSKGYIWFGTRNGLNKYDGSTMKVYKSGSGDGSPGLIHRQITALAEDHHGNLWIGTSQGLSCLDMDTDVITSYGAPAYPWLDTHIDEILIDSQDRVWLATSKGLWLFVPQSGLGQPLKLNGELDNAAVTVVKETADGHWAHSRKVCMSATPRSRNSRDIRMPMYCLKTISPTYLSTTRPTPCGWLRRRAE